MNGRRGSRRALTDAQVAAILDWHRARRTIGQVARAYGVSKSTIGNIIRTGGAYKSASPEMRAHVAHEWKVRLDRLRAQAFL